MSYSIPLYALFYVLQAFDCSFSNVSEEHNFQNRSLITSSSSSERIYPSTALSSTPQLLTFPNWSTQISTNNVLPYVAIHFSQWHGQNSNTILLNSKQLSAPFTSPPALSYFFRCEWLQLRHHLSTPTLKLLYNTDYKPLKPMLNSSSYSIP